MRPLAAVLFAFACSFAVAVAADPVVKPLAEKQRKEVLAKWEKDYTERLKSYEANVARGKVLTLNPDTRDEGQAVVDKYSPMLAALKKDAAAVLYPITTTLVGEVGRIGPLAFETVLVVEAAKEFTLVDMPFRADGISGVSRFRLIPAVHGAKVDEKIEAKGLWRIAAVQDRGTTTLQRFDFKPEEAPGGKKK